MNIYTSSYNNCKAGNLVSISLDKGKDANFYGDSHIALAHKRDFFRTCKDNRTKLNKDENNLYYIAEFYNRVLSFLDAKEVLEDLSTFGDDVIILCYEDSNDFCFFHCHS